MSAPLTFLNDFAEKLRENGIRFAITSGMACVFYRIQQTTKDSDWIVPPTDLSKLRELLRRLERETPPWRVSYRPIFGAPLEEAYMTHGWTSHLSIWDRADSLEHHVDLFSKPPRVSNVETSRENPNYATRHVVAQMKRTDRLRDWPIVDGLGLQLQAEAVELALLHIQNPQKLIETWADATCQERDSATKRRPLLRKLAEIDDPDRLEAWIRLERLIWETVNEERYGCYGKAWKEFYRRWRQADGFTWPTREPISLQHDRLVEAVGRFGLPADPVGDIGKETLYERALERAAVRGDATRERLAALQPSIEEVLP